MTPTEQDKELEQGIDTQILLRTKIRNTLYNHEIGFSMARAGDKTAEQMADELVEQLFDISTKLITADRKRVALEARIGELENNKWLPNEAKWIEQEAERIAELKAQQEEV